MFESATDMTGETFRREVAQHKWLFTASAILSIVAGIVAIGVPPLAAISIELVVGALFLVTGAVETVRAFWAGRAGRVVSSLFVGLLGVLAGVVLLVFPLQGVIALSLFLAFYFLVSGIVRSVLAFRMRREDRWGWMLAAGLVSILLGLLIFSGLPGNAGWVLGIIVGIDLIFSGFGMLMLISAVRDNGRETGANEAGGERGDKSRNPAWQN